MQAHRLSPARGRPTQQLPADNYVLGVFKEVLQASGTDVLRQVGKLYRRPAAPG